MVPVGLTALRFSSGPDATAERGISMPDKRQPYNGCEATAAAGHNVAAQSSRLLQTLVGQRRAEICQSMVLLRCPLSAALDKPIHAVLAEEALTFHNKRRCSGATSGVEFCEGLSGFHAEVLAFECGEQPITV